MYYAMLWDFFRRQSKPATPAAASNKPEGSGVTVAGFKSRVAPPGTVTVKLEFVDLPTVSWTVYPITLWGEMIGIFALPLISEMPAAVSKPKGATEKVVELVSTLNNRSQRMLSAAVSLMKKSQDTGRDTVEENDPPADPVARSSTKPEPPELLLLISPELTPIQLALARPPWVAVCVFEQLPAPMRTEQLPVPKLTPDKTVARAAVGIAVRAASGKARRAILVALPATNDLAR